MHDIEAWLLDGRPPRYVQLATAAAPEGERSLKRWHDLGAQAAARLGAEQVVVDVRTRADANNPALASLITGAGLIYLSGGNPGYLARTLVDTAVWTAIRHTWQQGASLAGCSAGAMALGGYVPDFRHPRSGGTAGLGLIPALRVLPHFDRTSRWIPGFAMRPLVDPRATVVGIDEDTALVGEPLVDAPDAAPWPFRSRGRQSAWRITGDRPTRINGAIDLTVDYQP
jgi:cyanophycinase-like exopeptidase